MNMIHWWFSNVATNFFFRIFEKFVLLFILFFKISLLLFFYDAWKFLIPWFIMKIICLSDHRIFRKTVLMGWNVWRCCHNIIFPWYNWWNAIFSNSMNSILKSFLKITFSMFFHNTNYNTISLLFWFSSHDFGVICLDNIFTPQN